MSIPSVLAGRLIPIASPGAGNELGATATTTPEHRVGVPHEFQIGTLWCWAAVSVCMRRFVRKDLPPMSQAELARIRLGHTHAGDCDPVGSPEICNKVAVLTDALSDAGITVKSKGVLALPLARKELELDRPLCARIDFPSSAERPPHFIQIDGFRGTDMYLINDPARGQIVISESNLLTNYDGVQGKWKATFPLP